MPKNTQFIKDKRGKTIRVVLSIRQYEKMMEELEELEDIRAADEAKSSTETPIPYREYRERRLKARK